MNRSDKQTKKGGTFLGVVVALFILLGMTSMLVTTSRYFSQNQKDIRTLTVMQQTAANEVFTLYTQDGWASLQDKQLETSVGELAVSYDYRGLTAAYRTQVLTVTFALGEHAETYQLERSVTFDAEP